MCHSHLATEEEVNQLFSESSKFFQEAIELPPVDLQSRAVIARAYTRLGYTRWMLSMGPAIQQGLRPELLADAQADFQRSIDLLEKLIADSPDDPRFRRYLVS